MKTAQAKNMIEVNGVFFVNTNINKVITLGSTRAIKAWQFEEGKPEIVVNPVDFNEGDFVLIVESSFYDLLLAKAISAEASFYTINGSRLSEKALGKLCASNYFSPSEFHDDEGDIDRSSELLTEWIYDFSHDNFMKAVEAEYSGFASEVAR